MINAVIYCNASMVSSPIEIWNASLIITTSIPSHPFAVFIPTQWFLTRHPCHLVSSVGQQDELLLPSAPYQFVIAVDFPKIRDLFKNLLLEVLGDGAIAEVNCFVELHNALLRLSVGAWLSIFLAFLIETPCSVLLCLAAEFASSASNADRLRDASNGCVAMDAAAVAALKIADGTREHVCIKE